MLNKKLLLVTFIAAAVCFSACAKGGTEVTETTSESAAETYAETTTAADTTAAAETKQEEDIPIIDSPEAAVKKYLNDLSESENVTAVEFHETRIGQRYGAADKYYESPLAEKFGITEDTYLVPVNVDYYIEYAENFGLESGEKSEYFIVSAGQNGFYVVDTLPYDPKDYYGEVKDILTDGDGNIEFYMVELDGGLGTVKCKNMVWYPDTQKFEVGERIRINANGDVYGDPPTVDAITLTGEDELSGGD